MTAQEVYTLSVAYLFEQPGKDADFQSFFLNFLNMLMGEALPTENAIREARGEEILEEAPFLTDFTQEVPFDGMITRVAFPYGVASLYLRDDMDNYNSQDYRARYINALAEALQYAYKYRTDEGLVKDVYHDSYESEAD